MSMIERVARAICMAETDWPVEVVWEQYSTGQQKQWRDAARAAMEAMLNPTEAMIAAGESAAWDRDNCMPAIRAIPAAWQAMLQAALHGDQEG